MAEPLTSTNALNEASTLPPTCPITNSYDVKSLQLIPASMEDSEVNRLAPWLGIDPSTFRFDDPCNLLSLECHLQRAYRKGRLWLVPDYSFLEECLSNAESPDPNPVSIPEDTVWNYTLVATEDMTGTKITAFQNGQETSHSYPFRNLSVIKSRVNPYLVIWNAAQKLTKHRATISLSLAVQGRAELDYMFTMMNMICHYWNRKRVKITPLVRHRSEEIPRKPIVEELRDETSYYNGDGDDTSTCSTDMDVGTHMDTGIRMDIGIRMDARTDIDAGTDSSAEARHVPLPKWKKSVASARIAKCFLADREDLVVKVTDSDESGGSDRIHAVIIAKGGWWKEDGGWWKEDGGRQRRLSL